MFQAPVYQNTVQHRFHLHMTPNSDVIFKGFIFNGVRIKNCCQIPTKSKKVFTQSSAKIKAWCKRMHGIEDIMTKM